MILFAKILLRTSQPVEAVLTSANAADSKLVAGVPGISPNRFTEL